MPYPFPVCEHLPSPCGCLGRTSAFGFLLPQTEQPVMTLAPWSMPSGPCVVYRLNNSLLCLTLCLPVLVLLLTPFTLLNACILLLEKERAPYLHTYTLPSFCLNPRFHTDCLGTIPLFCLTNAFPLLFLGFSLCRFEPSFVTLLFKLVPTLWSALIHTAFASPCTSGWNLNHMEECAFTCACP